MGISKASCNTYQEPIAMSKQHGSTRWASQVGGCPVGVCSVGYQLQGVSGCARSKLCIRLYIKGCNDCVSAWQGLAVRVCQV